VAAHQGPRSENWGQPPAEVGVPLAQRVEKRPVERDTRIPKISGCGGWSNGWWEFLLHLHPPPPVTPGGITLSDSEKAEAFAVSLETQFQPVTDPSVLAVIEMVYVALRSYILAPASEPKLTNPD